jgi:hypothetical protein
MNIIEAYRIIRQLGMPLSKDKRVWISDKKVLEAIKLTNK